MLFEGFFIKSKLFAFNERENFCCYFESVLKFQTCFEKNEMRTANAKEIKTKANKKFCHNFQLN